MRRLRIRFPIIEGEIEGVLGVDVGIAVGKEVGIAVGKEVGGEVGKEVAIEVEVEVETSARADLSLYMYSPIPNITAVTPISNDER